MSHIRFSVHRRFGVKAGEIVKNGLSDLMLLLTSPGRETEYDDDESMLVVDMGRCGNQTLKGDWL
jgi:hypothetical protein